MDVTARLMQHRDGPLTQGKIKGVEYVWGPKFDEHAQVVTRPTEGFGVTVSLYSPLLLLARVSFTDGEPPLVLARYVNFDEDTRQSQAESPRFAGNRVEQLRSGFGAQRQAVREHLPELGQVLGPGRGASPHGDPKTEIGAMLLGGYFQDRPIKPSEFPGIIELLDLYRREPWTPDPQLNITPLTAQGPQGQRLWQMSLDPLKAYTVHADQASETLELIKRTLLQDLIPRMRNWDKWH